jgi:hypothetical protein
MRVRQSKQPGIACARLRVATMTESFMGYAPDCQWGLSGHFYMLCFLRIHASSSCRVGAA